MTCPFNSQLPTWAQEYERLDTFAEIQEVMRSTDFVQGGTPARRIFLGDTLVMTDGDEHLERKKVVSALFTREAMSRYETQLLEPVIAQVMGELKAQRGADGLARTDLVPLIRILLLRISARIVGVDGVDTPQRTERFRRVVAQIADAIGGQFNKQDMAEVVANGLATMKALVDEFLQSSLDRRLELVRQYRSGGLAKEDLPVDVLTLICLHDNEHRTGEVDSEHNRYVWRECALFLTASTQTSTLSLPHIFRHLSEWFQAHPEDATKIDDLSFMRKAIAESLRLHQAAPLKFRIAANDVTLASGKKIAKGQMVGLNAPLANFEEALFGKDPTVFNPYRERPTGAQPWGLTFGSGMHMCMGRSLVTGVYQRPEDPNGTEGTMVKILRALYACGAELDPEQPPQRTTLSFHDLYESMPVILRKL